MAQRPQVAFFPANPPYAWVGVISAAAVATGQPERAWAIAIITFGVPVAIKAPFAGSTTDTFYR